MRKLWVVLITLSLVGVFSNPSWAQPADPEEDPQSVNPSGIEAATRIEAEKLQDFQKVEGLYYQVEKTNELQRVEGQYDQVEKAQELQQVEGLEKQAATIDGCKVQSIKVLKGDSVNVESGCSTDGAQVSNRVLRGSEGVVRLYDDGSGPIEFKSIESGKQASAEVQYDSAMKIIGQTIQEVSVAHRYRRFGKVEDGKGKCNQFTTEQGVKYEVFAIAALSEKNQPIIRSYKINQTIDGNTVTIDVSMDSLYKGAFSGMLPAIHAGGCPLSEWMEIKTGAETKTETISN